MKSEIYILKRNDEIEEEIEPFCSDGCVETYAENQGIKQYDVNLASEKSALELDGQPCEWCKSPCGE